LSDVAVSIAYSATITNNATGVVVVPNGSVNVGDTLTLQFTPHVYTDVVWNGIGYATDTPFGEWRTGAASPGTVSCDENEYVAGSITDTPVYVPLVVSPPVKSISGLSGLMCGALLADGTMQCTVTQAVPLAIQFNLASTYGKFYYRYSPRDGGGCYGNNVPLREALVYTYYMGVWIVTGVSASDYTLQVPAQTIPYHLTAVSSNNPPTAPVITGPTTLHAEESGSYTFRSTDPDNDQVKYGIDWNNDSIVDSWSTLGASGWTYTEPHVWNTSGAKSFRALAQDSNGGTSGWSTYSPTVIISPDLVAGSVNQNTATVNVGLKLSTLVTNNGKATTGLGFYTLFQRADNLAFTTNVQPLGTGYRGLPLGSTKAVTITTTSNVTFPAVRTYYVRACADKQSAADTGLVLNEWNTLGTGETNNCSTPTTLVVTNPPTYNCTGTIPAGAEPYPAPDNTGLTVDTPYQYAEPGTARKCEYHCPVGATWNGASCDSVLDPVATIDANPMRVRRGNNTTVTWSAQNVASNCTISGPGLPGSPITTSGPTINSTSASAMVNSQSAYTISCDSGAATDSVTVNVVPEFTPF